MSFDWLNNIIEGLLKIIPRPVIVRATHKGVKWVRGKNVKILNPGFHIIWPLTTEWDIIVAARQTNNLPDQALITKDNKQIVIGGIIVFSVDDVELAIGEKNWDHSQTVNDIAQSVIVNTVSKWTFNELTANVGGKLDKEVTSQCRKELKEFGIKVEKIAFTDLSTCRVIKLMGHEIIK